DRLGHADDGEAFAVELQCRGETAVSAHADEARDTETAQGAEGIVHQLGGNDTNPALTHLAGEMSPVGGAQNGSPQLQNTLGLLDPEHFVVAGREESLV